MPDDTDDPIELNLTQFGEGSSIPLRTNDEDSETFWVDASDMTRSSKKIIGVLTPLRVIYGRLREQAR